MDADVTPAPSPTASPPRGAWRRSWLLKRALPLLLVVGIAAWYFHDAPRDLTLAVDLTGQREGLVALQVEVSTVPEGLLARHVELHYSPSSPSPMQQRISLRLTPGEYQAELLLDYGARTARSGHRFKVERQEGEMIVVRPGG